MSLRLTEQQYAEISGRQRAGHARADALTPERRSEIASLGGRARWAGKTQHGNVPTEVDGFRFPSKREAQQYVDLKTMKATGLIRGFTRQVSLPLASAKRRMVIDFMVVENDGRVRFLDAKGFSTQLWKTKRDELEYSLGIKIETV